MSAALAPRHALHADAVEAALARTAAWRATQEAAGACAGCGLRASCCLCGAVQPLGRWPHAVDCLVHASELRKTSSTHTLLARACGGGACGGGACGGGGGACGGACGGSSVAVWRSAAARDAGIAWARVAAAAAAAGRAACVLFPTPGAAPAAAWCAAARARGARGLHILVLDGTWSNVRAMEAEVPAEAPRVVVAPPGTYTLFGPCRAPPAPGRISSLEAVACLVDAWRVSGRGAPATAPRVLAPAPVLAADPPGSLRVLIRTSTRGEPFDGCECGRQRRRLHCTGSTDDTAPKIRRLRPVCPMLRAYADATTDHGRKRNHHGDSDELRRALDALGDVADPWAQSIWQKLGRERRDWR